MENIQKREDKKKKTSYSCKYVFIFGKCGCECHTQAPETQIAKKEAETEEDLLIIEDPRPWRNK